MSERSDRKLRMLEGVITYLTHKLQAPSKGNPTTRCLKRSHLMNLLRDALDSVSAKGVRHPELATGPKALEALEATGLVRELNIVQVHTNPTRLYLFDARGDEAERRLSPLEVLQATEPAGFACYWTAVEFHSLSTQPCRHHHIGVARPAPRGPAEPGGVPMKKYSLGIHLFDYAETPYYRNGRDVRLVPDIRKTYVNEYAEIQITSLEQTLLDTLHRPHSCGGPEVVLEAWDEAVARLDQEILADLLLKIGRPMLNRRVGLLLEDTETQLEPALAEVVSTARTPSLPGRERSHENGQEDPRPSLLPGVRFSNWNRKWQLLTP